MICVLTVEQGLQQVNYIATSNAIRKQTNLGSSVYIWEGVYEMGHEALQLERRYVKGRHLD